ncbi:SEL1-like repeat protein [Rheinheimera salexigens]|uniref:Sel1 repeat family protein n=1 Tax=Rheinheimera salexigens TaxID=1628148 RepID=A0A1E7Q4N6_9GAMM|nr:sel1 repeat family protein [Rheinheimera salexigens]OEY69135.1 hypothetical protein BI198_05755 [Rheinheimera salexigens]
MKKLAMVALATSLLTGVFSPNLYANDAVGAEEKRIRSFLYTTDFDNAIGQVQRREFAEAYPNLLQFARYGEKYAQYSLGLLLVSGEGVPLDIEQGLVWMRLALEQKTSDWEKRYEAVTKNLTKEQMAALEPMYQEYKRKYGADAQNMRCASETRRGSNMRIHVCRKTLLNQEFYSVVEYAEDKPTN